MIDGLRTASQKRGALRRDFGQRRDLRAPHVTQQSVRHSGTDGQSGTRSSVDVASAGSVGFTVQLHPQPFIIIVTMIYVEECTVIYLFTVVRSSLVMVDRCVCTFCCKLLSSCTPTPLLLSNVPISDCAASADAKQDNTKRNCQFRGSDT